MQVAHDDLGALVEGRGGPDEDQRIDSILLSGRPDGRRGLADFSRRSQADPATATLRLVMR